MKFINAMVAIIFILTFIVMVGCAVFMVRGCKEVEKHGLKNVIEKTWNGPTNGVH